MFVYVSTILELIKFFLLFRFGFYLEFRERRRYMGLAVLCISMTYASMIHYLGVEPFELYLIWIVIAMNILFHVKMLRISLWTIGGVALIGLFDSFSVIIIDVGSHLFDFELNQNIHDILASVLTILAFIISYVVIFRRERGFFCKIGYLRMIQIYLIGFLYTLLLTMSWDNLTEQITSFQNGMNVYAVFLLIVVSAYYQIVSTIRLALSNKKLQEKDRINQNLVKLQENQYEYLKSTNQDTRKFRHDVKNHILVLMNLCKEQQFHEMEVYLEQISGKIENISFGYHINHSIVDAIINQFSFQCKEKNIIFQVKGYLPSDCCITYYDISTIITNILQNAYEAVCDCKQKEIYLTIRYDDFRLYIKEENTYCYKLIQKNGVLQSLKMDFKNHGFGMENIRDSLKNYNGNINYESIESGDKENKFVLQVVLNYR